MNDDYPGAVTCSSCAYWHVLTETSGECRRYPPRRESADMPQSHHPVTEWGDWCGEWVRKGDPDGE